VRSVAFHPEAEAELASAAQYFESHVETLGLDFIVAVRRAPERILEFPDSGHPFGRRLRRTLVRGFPYGLLYRVEPSRIFIVAVAHLHRRPGLLAGTPLRTVRPRRDRQSRALHPAQRGHRSPCWTYEPHAGHFPRPILHDPESLLSGATVTGVSSGAGQDPNPCLALVRTRITSRS
jgi:toxin ParE2